MTSVPKNSASSMVLRMSEALRPHHRDHEVDEQDEGDDEADGLRGAHHRRSSAQTRPANIASSATLTRTITRSTVLLLREPSRESGSTGSDPESSPPLESRRERGARVCKTGFTIVAPAPRPWQTRAVSTIRPSRGRLRIYLGGAAGVGKTYACLGDALLARDEGVDVLLGYLEPHGRERTEERARSLERAPVLGAERGRAETEVDVDWLLERRPTVAIVDELAHTNASGSARP